MYAFTAAHKTVPLPSYARVTNLDNGKMSSCASTIAGRSTKPNLIDLSYVAAVKIGVWPKGTGSVEVARSIPTSGRRTGAAAAACGQPAQADCRAIFLQLGAFSAIAPTPSSVAERRARDDIDRGRHPVAPA